MDEVVRSKCQEGVKIGGNYGPYLIHQGLNQKRMDDGLVARSLCLAEAVFEFPCTSFVLNYLSVLTRVHVVYT